MKKIIFIFTLLSVVFFWNCSNEFDPADEWTSAARVWESKLGDYRGGLTISVDGLPMDTVVQQISFSGDDYNRVNMIISTFSIQDKGYGYIYFNELSLKESNGIIYIKGKQNSNNSLSALGLVVFEIDGQVKDDVLSFDLTINGVNTLELELNMISGIKVDEFPSADASIEAITLVEEDKLNSPFITGTPSIDNSYGVLTFFVADTLTITDSTFFAVKPTLELAPGAWIEPDTTMNWTVTHSDIEDVPSRATTDSLYRFSEYETAYLIKVWAADSIRYRNYAITYTKSNAIDISLFHWEDRGEYSEPIAGWATNNAYIQKLSEVTPSLKDIYVYRALGAKIGDIGARMETAVLGTVEDSNIVVVPGKLFRGVFDMDSLNTPKLGELHGIPFSKRKPVSLRGQYRYIPGEVLYIGDSILPDSILSETDSCYIEAFLYESVTPEIYLDSLDYMKDAKVIGHAKFVSGRANSFRDFSMHFDVRNWIPTRRYHLGIVCKSSGKYDDRIGAPGSSLVVSGFELMSTDEIR